MIVNDDDTNNFSSSQTNTSNTLTSHDVSLIPQMEGNDTVESQGPVRVEIVEMLNRNENRPGARKSLADRLSPLVPEPTLAVDTDEYGWGLIDQVGGWQAFLCEFPVLEEIPSQHKSVWTWAWGFVLEKIISATTPIELNRSLMWLLFLPQALLRMPKRGGKSGRNLTAQ